MDRARAVRALVVAAMAAVVVQGLTSCISAQERDYVKYDAGRDEFSMLMVLSDIQVTEQDDLGYLEALYRNRDHWLAPVIPGAANVMPLLGWSLLRTGDKAYSPLNIFASRPTTFETAATEVDLSAVKVVPGAFFVEGGKLGYYQGVTVPGKVIDGALAEISKAAVSEDVGKGIGEELARRSGGGKVATWAELKAQTLKGITMDMPGAAAPTEANATEQLTPLNVLSAESLKALQAAAADKTLALKREKTVLSVALPLTAADATGAADLWKAALEKTEQAVKEAKETPENKDRISQGRAFVMAGKLVKVEAGASGLKASVDLVGFAESVVAGAAGRVDMNNKDAGGGEKPAAPDAAAYLKEKGIVPEAGLTAAGIVKDFQAGTLKGHPSGTAVKAGEGIVGKHE
jgi:hypothetical protein